MEISEVSRKVRWVVGNCKDKCRYGGTQEKVQVTELANMDMHLDLSLLVDPLLVIPANKRSIKLEEMCAMELNLELEML